MNESVSFKLPAVSDEDVEWVCRVMKLPSDAFTGPDGHDPRLKILQSSETLDIEACPGSGKTTLLVAKLAILAKKWVEPHRGLCVLSHTNAARREIEERLGGTPEGGRLLSYPHYVGTIHGFVNQFLALPWLRSKPLPITMINDEVALGRRWSKLPKNTRDYLRRKRNAWSLLKVKGPDFSVGSVRNLNETADTYQKMKRVCEDTCREGYFCYDEMFIWANELLDHVPDVKKMVRERFPVVFIDEVQDNSEIQSALLFRVFMEEEDPVVRQRFGDSNQAIFRSPGDDKGATTDVFPNPDIRKSIPNSHRFGQEIAGLANPLAPEPPGLVGRGPSQGPENKRILADTSGQHTIFLFDDQTVTNVLSAYARHLLQVLSDRELQQGTFAAVGSVHRYEEGKPVPYSVCDYWPDYVPGLTTSASNPSRSCHFIQSGQRLSRDTGEAHWEVEGIAGAILQLVRILNPKPELVNRRQKHRYILELLDNQPELKARYIDAMVTLTATSHGPTTAEWEMHWLPLFKDIATVISGVPVIPNLCEIEDFLKWPVGVATEREGESPQCDNVYGYSAGSPRVQIQVGSIHSVKGKTHTATLVLETYYRALNLKKLKPWLIGKKSGKGTELAMVRRLRQHYVAMTRPTHLLCLAMREDSYKKREVERLKSRWRLARVTATDTLWL